jgi:hypothetical protein
LKTKATQEWGDFDFKKELSALEAQRQYLAEFGITGYFEKSYALMLSWL